MKRNGLNMRTATCSILATARSQRQDDLSPDGKTLTLRGVYRHSRCSPHELDPPADSAIAQVDPPSLPNISRAGAAMKPGPHRHRGCREDGASALAVSISPGL